MSSRFAARPCDNSRRPDLQGASSSLERLFGVLAPATALRVPEAGLGLQITLETTVMGAYAPSRRMAFMVCSKPRMLRTRLKL